MSNRDPEVRPGREVVPKSPDGDSQLGSLNQGQLPSARRGPLSPVQLAALRNELVLACIHGDLPKIEQALPMVEALDLTRYGSAQRGVPSAIVDASLCIAIVGAFHPKRIPDKTLDELHTQLYISGTWDAELAGTTAATAFAWGVVAGSRTGEWDKIKMRIIATNRDFQAAPLLQAAWLTGLGAGGATREEITHYLLKIAAIHSRLFNARAVAPYEQRDTQALITAPPLSNREISKYISNSPTRSRAEGDDGRDPEEIARLERFAERLIRFNPEISRGLETWFRKYGNSPLRKAEHGGTGAIDFFGADAPKLGEVAKTTSERALSTSGEAPKNLAHYMAEQALRVLKVQQAAEAWTNREIEQWFRSLEDVDSWLDQNQT